MCPADPDVAAGLAFHIVRPIVAAEFTVVGAPSKCSIANQDVRLLLRTDALHAKCSSVNKVVRFFLRAE